jgi:hypothetical protein
MFAMSLPDDDLAATCLCPRPAFEKSEIALERLIIKIR